MTIKKTTLIPVIAVSAMLLLSACSATSSDTATPTSTSSSTGGASYIAPPVELEDKFEGYFIAPTTMGEHKNSDSWEYYEEVGSKTYGQDPEVRSMTVEDYNSLNTIENMKKMDKVYGEISSDVEQSAMNISKYIGNKSSKKLEDINKKDDLIVNRYEKVGKVEVHQDTGTKFFFVTFTHKAGNVVYGILVPQEDVTPDFSAKSPENQSEEDKSDNKKDK